jgi:hypothetical protein
LVLGLEIGLSLASQVPTGALTAALPDQAHDGLQQSQYRVVFPLPEACAEAKATRPAAVRRDSTAGLCMVYYRIIVEVLGEASFSDLLGWTTAGVGHPSHR